MKKALPIGVSDFKEIIENNYYFVDKSLLIKELLDTKAKVTLFPRPRRFGKTLNMSMLHYFFEINYPAVRMDSTTLTTNGVKNPFALSEAPGCGIERDSTNGTNAHLFKDLAVNKYPDIMAHQGQYPVIFLTFKDVKTQNWDHCYRALKTLLGNEFRRHSYLLQSGILDDAQKKRFQAILDGTADQEVYEFALKDLSAYLNAYHKKPVLILIDEYDMPIIAGYTFDYYDDVVCFLRNFLSGGLKDNSNLAYGVMTGIVRIAKESIFSGLNNLEVCSLASDHYADKFGLLENDVIEILSYYNLATNVDDVRSWFNGYTSGPIKVYNPWSIINCARNKGNLEPYWINTSSNDLIKKLLQEGSSNLKDDLEVLLQNKPLTKQLDDGFVFPELTMRDDAVWSLLFYSGYLTFQNKRLEQRKTMVDFVIPNSEVLAFFETSIQHWFVGSSVIGRQYNDMLTGLVSGNVTLFSTVFPRLVLQSLSSFDLSGKEPERFYHALVVGMLLSLQDRYQVRSNRESGAGRYDVMIIPNDASKIGIILEFKRTGSDRKETLKQAAASALQQIIDKDYETELRSRGVAQIIKLGIAFQGKRVSILQG